jgi:hypothetical protein
MLLDGRWHEVNASAGDQKLAATKFDVILGRPEGKPPVRVALKSCELGGGASAHSAEKMRAGGNQRVERRIAS